MSDRFAAAHQRMRPGTSRGVGPLARRASRAVAWATELTDDAIRHGLDSGRHESGEGLTRGEAAESEWQGAVVALVRWGLS